MAPKHVYGRRARGSGDAFAGLAATNSIDTTPKDTTRTTQTSPRKSKSTTYESDANSKSVLRRPLAEVHINVVPALVAQEFEACEAHMSRARRAPKSTSEEAISPKRRTHTRQHARDDPTKKTTRTKKSSMVDLATKEYDETLQPAQSTRPGRTRKAKGESQILETPCTSAEPTLCDHIYVDHCRALLDLSDHPISPFTAWADAITEHFNLSKIAEASFGEVYRVTLREQLDGLDTADESVFKVIALQPPESRLPTNKRSRAAALKKAAAMSKVESVVMETLLLQRMSCTPGFTNFRELRIVQGRPPPLFIQAFEAYNGAQRARDAELSVFPDPAKKTSYNEDQLWVIIEMQDAGTDLERLLENRHCTSIWSVWDVFWSVTLSLAKGEQEAEFEHRDLHVGNVCVQHAAKEVDESCIDRKRKLDFTGLRTTIIDYTISRCTLDQPASVHNTNSQIAYQDLALPSEAFLFEADSSEEYQYEIYRYMRAAVYQDDASAKWPPRTTAAKQRSWKDFHPVTNLVWLHFLLFKLCHVVQWPSAQSKPSKKSEGKQYRRWKRANELEMVLRAVGELLQPAAVCQSQLLSASGLVCLAVENGWLDEADVHDHAEVSEGETIPGDAGGGTVDDRLLRRVATMKL